MMSEATERSTADSRPNQDFRDLIVGVAGAGTMGAGIAQVAAWAGHRVILYDIQLDYVNRGLSGLSSFLRRGAEKGRYPAETAEAAIARIHGSTDPAAFAPCGLVIEAAPESLEIKHQLFERLEAVCEADAILASNTSTLSIAAIARVLRRPERAAGLHFFNPAPLMPLVEVIRSDATDAKVVDRLVELARAWGKEPVLAADTPGFIVNRVARPFYGEGLRLVGEGVTEVATVDRLARDAGFPMGPFELMDLIGIDINYAAASSVYDGFFMDPRFRPHPIQRRMVESGRLGRKTGRGYYDYASA
jgi:3-hydroxybutyryl-CoA dehydrogenase